MLHSRARNRETLRQVAVAAIVIGTLLVLVWLRSGKADWILELLD